MPSVAARHRSTACHSGDGRGHVRNAFFRFSLDGDLVPHLVYGAVLKTTMDAFDRP